MKNLLYTLALVFVSNLALAQSTNKNYVKSTNYQLPVKNQTEIDALSNYNKTESVTYYDGLGRPEQSIALRVGGESSVSQTNALVYDWSTDNYSSSFYRPIGQSNENTIINSTTPFGDTDLVWQCGSDTANDADGGWNTAFQGVDNTKTYRYTVWVKRTGDITKGRAYHGTQNVNNLDGTANPNPYFFSNFLPEANKWYLLVGIIHPHDYSGSTDTGESGLYEIPVNSTNPNNTNNLILQPIKVADGAEFKWRPDTTISRVRSYFYYCTDANSKQYFWNPLLQEFNGNEYTLSEVQNLSEVQQNAGSKDVVTSYVYDEYSRQTKDFLPVPVANTNGLFKATDLVIADAENYYLNHFGNDLNTTGVVNIFSEKHLEASSLSRVLEQAAPGEDWKLNQTNDLDRTIKFDYQTNTTSEVSQFSVNFISGQTDAPQLIYDGNYPANQLYKSITKSENWQPNQQFDKDHTTEEFKNKQGQVILKRTYDSSAGIGNEAHDTYYIYDDYDNLTYVLSPEGSQVTETTTTNSAVNQSDLDDLCYQYKYDNRNRLIEKKIPGKGWESIVYDNLNRPILTQDALQAVKSPKQWLFTKYDELGRVAYTGLFENNSSRATLQTAVKNHAINNPSLLYETKQTTAINISQDPTTVLHYTNSAYPNNPSKIYTINYYDDYNWDTDTNLEASYFFSSGIPNTLTHSNSNHTKPFYSTIGWNAGFTSGKTIEADGYISFEATQLDKKVFVGLTDANIATPNNHHHSSIGYAIYLGYLNDRVIIFESGVQVLMVTTYYEVGDVFKVERLGNQILYKQNDTIIHISSTPSSGNLKGDSSFYDPGTTIDNVFIGHSYLGQAFTSKTKTLATGSKVRVLETNDWITSVSYYDDKARPIYFTTNNTYLDTKEAGGSQLDFVGKVIKTKHTQVRDRDAPIVTVDDFTYDHTGRLLAQQQQINNFDKQLLVKNTYDDLGQLVKKQVGGAIKELSSYNNVSSNITVTGNTITKNIGSASSWDAGLSTIETISGDGYTSYTVSQHNKYLMVSLSYSDPDYGYTNLNYAIYHSLGQVKVTESGTDLGVKTTYIANDSFKIERRGQTIYYLKNGEVFYISQVPCTSSDLLADVSMYHAGGQIKDLVLVNLEAGLQDVDYEYNIRGWLKQINDVDNLADDLFSFKLNYNTKDGNTTIDPLYNGNIAQTIWKTASIDPNETNVKRGYAYSYDALNRIKTGELYTGNGLLTPTNNYGLDNVSFDKNGNIMTLNRENKNGLMDQLSYIYDGNQLQRVDDAITTITDQGFIDGNTSGNDYYYDVNGNMIQDSNKTIGDITYNHLNLPTYIQIESSGTIDYVYDATGVKQKKIVTTSSTSNIKTTYYAGNFIYEQPAIQNMPRLKFFSHAEGYIEPTHPAVGTKAAAYNYINKIDYVYQFKDHLGNIRLSYSDTDNNGVIDAANEIIEENNYYPFGLKHKGYNNVINGTDHKYGFQEQEENDELGLNWISFKWRNHDPAIGRFMNIDPLTEDYMDWGPYVFSGNIVINARELEGLEPIYVAGTSQDKTIIRDGSKPKGGNSVTADVFKTFFPEGGAARELIDHYAGGTGETYSLNQKQMLETYPLSDGKGNSVNLSLTKTDMMSVGDLSNGESKTFSDDVKVYAGANGTLGNFSVTRTGEISVNEETGLREFNGTFEFNDVFDFNASNHRSGSAEFQVTVARNFLPGASFSVTGQMSVNQTQGQNVTTMFNNIRIFPANYPKSKPTEERTDVTD